jgi:hypothetical protein
LLDSFFPPFNALKEAVSSIFSLILIGSGPNGPFAPLSISALILTECSFYSSSNRNEKSFGVVLDPCRDLETKSK